MRSDRELRDGPTVEFTGEDPEPSAAAESVVRARPARDRALIAGGVLIAVLALAAVGHDHSAPKVAHKPQATLHRQWLVPQTTPAPAAVLAGQAVTDSPSAAITKAFDADIPGSVVLYERTSLTDRGRELESRTIRAVTGNVVLDIVIGRGSGPLPSHATQVRLGGYAVTIRSTGFYAPSRKQLRRLATDRRLTAVV
jgi:hypothetical protein